MEWRRSWQDESRLERLAWRIGITPDELRESLRRQVAERGAPVKRPEPTTRLPSAEEWVWIKAQPPEVRVAIIEELLAATA